MTSTSQNPAEGTGGLEPTNKAPEAQKEARQVPLDALAEARQKARAAEERAKELESEVARLKGSGAPAAAQPQSEIERIGKTLADMQRNERIRNMAVELALPDVKQAEVVASLIDKNADLTPVEALEIAAKRQPDLFKDRGQSGYDPRIHGSQRPTSVPNQPASTSDRQERLSAMKKMTGTDKARYVNNYVGGIAAKAMGWDSIHQKIPLTKKN
ncbi:MAG: hypothetical protein ACK5QX_01645 [bacterium]